MDRRSTVAGGSRLQRGSLKGSGSARGSGMFESRAYITSLAPVNNAAVSSSFTVPWSSKRHTRAYMERIALTAALPYPW